MVSPEQHQPTCLHDDLDSFIYPSRITESDQMTLRSNPLDELDCVNHYCFGGKKNLCRNFYVLTLNDHSPGDETLFLAVQLRGTDSKVVHFDWSPLAVDLVRTRATKLGLSDNILWASESLNHIHNLFTQTPAKNSGDENSGDENSTLGWGQFDYIRCCGALDRVWDFETTFDEMLKFLRPTAAALGMTCLGKYGREPYRHYQRIAQYLNSDDPGTQTEVDRLKELFVFLPEKNWTHLSYDNLRPEIRSMKDDAFAAHFLRKDLHTWTIPQVYDLLKRKNLDLANFSRKTRMMYQPWFAQKNSELFELIQSLPLQDTQAVAEIVWNTIEEHSFWATREVSARVDPNHWNNVLFFNPIPQTQKKWREKFLQTPNDAFPQLYITPAHGDSYTVDLPWDARIRRMIELIDGMKSFKDIIMIIRGEMETPLGTEEIMRSCGNFLVAAELEDVILMRHRNSPILPFTARTMQRERTQK